MNTNEKFAATLVAMLEKKELSKSVLVTNFIGNNLPADDVTEWNPAEDDVTAEMQNFATAWFKKGSMKAPDKFKTILQKFLSAKPVKEYSYEEEVKASPRVSRFSGEY